MDEKESLSHTKWECKYHVVWIPKYRKKKLFEGLRKDLGAVFRFLAEQRECKVLEGHLRLDHVHMLLSIPKKKTNGSISYSCYEAAAFRRHMRFNRFERFKLSQAPGSAGGT